MKILVTGAKGFIGKNLILELRNRGFLDILEYDLDTDPKLLNSYCQKAEFIFHLAGVNRPEKVEDFMAGNFGFTSDMLTLLKKHKNRSPIMISSSIQSLLSNPYGISKKAGEDLLLKYSKETGAKVLIYRFPNVFGKWARPNYNSAIATFCHNLANGLPIVVNNRETEMTLVYIDDVVSELISALEGHQNQEGDYCKVKIEHSASLGRIVDLITSFSESRNTLQIPDLSDPLTKKLHATFLSYIPGNKLSSTLKMNVDNRGSFTEFLKTMDRGQVSVNVAKPGIVKGNHYHQSKNEKFLVVSGQAIIRLRKVDTKEVFSYKVSGDKLEVIEIIPGFTHNIENVGTTDLVTIMWANESFDPKKPDTYILEV